MTSWKKGELAHPLSQGPLFSSLEEEERGLGTRLELIMEGRT